MKNRISQRLNSFDSSAFRDVIMKKQSLQDPVDLSIGEPEDDTHEAIKQAGIEAINNNQTNYAPANGLFELREVLREKLHKENNINVPIDQISVTPGLTTGLLIVYMSILDPGDEIITIDPGYPPYDQLASALGAIVMPVVTLPTFQLDIPAIEASITDKTKAIVLNSPNNPTGAIYPEKDLRKVAAIAEKHGIYVISDEIYEHFTYDERHFSIGSIYPDTISMFGFSKQHSMTGWRVGYIVAPADIIEAINEIQQYAIFSSSTIAQHAAIEALKTDTILVDKYRKKRDLVVSTLEELSIDVKGAQGSYYVFFKAPYDLTDIEFIDKLLDHNLILIPGRALSSRHGYIRLSYGTNLDELKKGLSILTNVTNMLK